MTDHGTKIGTLEFESPINSDTSFSRTCLAEKTRSTMDLYFYKDNTGFIVWDIPDLDMTEHIGLTFSISPDGKRTLTEYDGIFAIPDQAMDLLEKHGVDCADMRKCMAD